MTTERCPNDEHTSRHLLDIASGGKTYTRVITLQCGVCAYRERIENAILIHLSEAHVLPTGAFKNTPTAIVAHGERWHTHTPFVVRRVEDYFELCRWGSYLKECPRWFSDFPKLTPDPPKEKKARESDVRAILDNAQQVIEDYLERYTCYQIDAAARNLCKTIVDYIPVDTDDVEVTVLNADKDRITVDVKLPSHVFYGWTAGELRAIGSPVAVSIPDEAVLTRDPESHVGALRFAWVELHYEKELHLDT